jgi:hypothetical protein
METGNQNKGMVRAPDREREPAAGMVEVTLKKLHTHEGVEYKAGDKLSLDPNTAKWMRDNGIAD